VAASIPGTSDWAQMQKKSGPPIDGWTAKNRKSQNSTFSRIILR